MARQVHAPCDESDAFELKAAALYLRSWTAADGDTAAGAEDTVPRHLLGEVVGKRPQRPTHCPGS